MVIATHPGGTYRERTARRSDSARIGSRRMPLVASVAPLIVALAVDATAQIRIVNYNVAQLAGDLTSLQNVLNAIVADDKPGFAVAPHIFIFQEVQGADATALAPRLVTAAPGVTYVRATYTTSGSEDGSAGAQCLFYRSDTFTEDVAGHVDIFTGRGRNADRWKLQLVGYPSSQATVYVYSCHLPAGSAPTDAADRVIGAQAMRDNADLLPANSHIIYAGDFNVYNNSEGAYTEFFLAGAGQATDALGTGSWAGSGNAIKHTQAPCNTGCTLVGGGMDDRFDLQLASNNFANGEGLSRITGTYRAFGNDGAHYNTDINAGNNTYYPADLPRSNALAGSLKFASDHVPVICEYQRPAKLSATLPASFGRVIQNATVAAQLSVTNSATAIIAAGADELDYNASGSGALSGVASGSVAALAAAQLSSFPIDTTTVGNVNGSVLVTSSSEAVEPPSVTRVISGTVVRPSNASFSAATNQTAVAFSRLATPNSGLHSVQASVFNRGFDSLQATLDLDSVAGVAAPFSFGGGLQTGIGSGSATLTFSYDSSGASAGLYVLNATINESDEDIPGAGTGTLTLSFSVRVRTLLSDVDNDCDVDIADLSGLLAAFGICAPDPGFVADADLDNNGCIDLADLTQLLADFGLVCP